MKNDFRHDRKSDSSNQINRGSSRFFGSRLSSVLTTF